MRTVTWNLCGLDERRLDERTEAACLRLLLRPDPPAVVWMQEVVRRSLYAHLRPHFSAAGYTLVPGEPVTDSEYFCVTAVHPSLSVVDGWIHRFEGSQMGRVLLGVRASLEGQDWLLLNAHLESLRSGSAERQRQLAHVVATLADHPGPAAFGGDTNLRDPELHAIPRLDEVRDAWRLAGSPAAARYTWDARRNGTGSRSVRRRFDRVFVNAHCRSAAVTTFGEEEVAGGLCVSDHLGLAVELEPVVTTPS